jgi:N-acetyl-gamma-glutamyl-phosphate reductase
VGIVGGTGYTAGELLRILVNHPKVEIKFVFSRSNPGAAVTSAHTDLAGDLDLRFTNKLEPADFLFLCLGHGVSRSFLAENPVGSETRIIDLGSDFRVNSTDDSGRQFVYGLPELRSAAIAEARNIANPGCFATAIQLALLPVVELLAPEHEIHVNAVTGSTGAGRTLSETSHFSSRESNMSIYNPFTHRHLDEITATLKTLSPALPEINFIPVRGNFTRGIFASVYTRCRADESEIRRRYEDYYADSPFTHVVGKAPCLKDALNTNKCLLNATCYGDRLLIVSVIDNLLKGASGQAVQNMNLMAGFAADCGLRLKPSGF